MSAAARRKMSRLAEAALGAREDGKEGKCQTHSSLQTSTAYERRWSQQDFPSCEAALG